MAHRKAAGLWTENLSDLPLFRALGDLPAPAPPAEEVIVRVVKRAARHDETKTYEEAHWDELSPAFRRAHNRLRRQRGQSAIPEPKVDNYTPRAPVMRPVDMADPEVRAAGRSFMGTALLGPSKGEGFTINGEEVRFDDLGRRVRSGPTPGSEGFRRG